jgi:hypothetical protein
MLTETLYYDPVLLKPWHAGTLPRRWFQEYGHIFDDDDLRITKRQRHDHFGEWYVAIHYAKQDYGVLVEKYIFKTHRRKYRILSRHLKHHELQFLSDGPKPPNPWHQPPDLFVFRGSEYFFVEVKRDRNTLRESQECWFEEIAKKLQCDVRVCYLKRM